MDKEKAIDRIQKLLKFNKQNNASQSEIEIAAKLVQGLLKQHDLTMYDVHEHTFKEGVVVQEYRLYYATYPHWIRELAGYIADALDCRVILSHWIDKERKYGTSFKTSVKFVGHQTDVEVAAYFLEVLERELWRLGGDHADKAGITGSEKGLYRKNFIVGASYAIYLRLKKPDPKVPQSVSHDLVVVKKHAVDEFMKEEFPDLKTKESGSMEKDWLALSAGARVGKKIPLHRGIKSANETLGITHTK